MYRAQLFQIMRRKINDDEPTTRRKRADRFGDNGFRMLRVMQDLVEDDGVEFTITQGQIVEVAQLYVDFTGDFGA